MEEVRAVTGSLDRDLRREGHAGPTMITSRSESDFNHFRRASMGRP